MNTGGPASEKTLRDEFAGQALPWCLSEFAGNSEDGTQYAPAAYHIAEAMLAEKARREGVSEIAPKDSDNRVIRVGWSLFSIADEALDSNDESRCFLHDWKEAVKGHREAVVQQSSTTESYITDKNGIPVARVTHAPISDHSPDAGKMAELQAANKELVEALEAMVAHHTPCHWVDTSGDQYRHLNQARTALSKHKGAA